MRNILAIVILAIASMACSATVDPGHVGIGVIWGELEQETYEPGFHWTGFTSVYEISTQVQATTATASAVTNDLQNVKTKVTLNWSRDPLQVRMQFENYPEIEGRIIAPAIQESVKAVVSNYDASQLVTQRKTVKNAVITLINERLEPIGVDVDTINITDFSFSEQFNKAIERKVEAEQNALRAVEELEQTKIEAEQAIVSAEGAKQSAILKAQGEAESLNIKGAALRRNPGVLELERLNAWDGQMPVTLVTNGSSPTLMVGSGGK